MTQQILLVEDNVGDAMLAQQAFKEAGVSVDLQIVGDGEQALQYVRRQGVHAGRARPELVLLDLKLPRVDGFTVLREVKADPELRQIPVVVLTTSGAEHDIRTAYALHANSYLRKPVTFEEFVRVASRVAEYWLDIVRLPSHAL